MQDRYDPEDITLLFKSVFETDDGKKVLDILQTKFSDQSFLPGSAMDGVSMAIYTHHRIGEDNVVRYIKKALSREIEVNAERRNEYEYE